MKNETFKLDFGVAASELSREEMSEILVGTAEIGPWGCTRCQEYADWCVPDPFNFDTCTCQADPILYRCL